MKNRSIAVIAVFMIITGANSIGIISNGSVRTVEFLSIFAFGALAGILVQQLIKTKSGA